jgi:ubiquinone/menaquinone biosynthesis C-methylase UbiE
MDIISIETIAEWQKQIKKGRKKLKKIAFGYFLPKRIKSKFKEIGREESNLLIHSLCNNFFSRYGSMYLKSERFKFDLIDLLIDRLNENRYYKMPWIDSVKRLDGASILEIGCGTGSSTVALAEQGSRVTAIDIDGDSLTVAKTRCELYGLHADFIIQNAAHINKKNVTSQFDIIVFYATLEHLTNRERILSLKNTWEMLPPRGLLIITSTPNRLWFYDSHTSLLPFYHWLPDDIAMQYARFSSREYFRNDFTPPNDSNMIQFLRWGRGVSFHELELAIKPVGELKVISSLSSYRKRKYPFASIFMNLLREYRNKHRYRKTLSKLFPNIPNAFFQETLDIILEKSGRKQP